MQYLGGGLCSLSNSTLKDFLEKWYFPVWGVLDPNCDLDHIDCSLGHFQLILKIASNSGNI